MSLGRLHVIGILTAFTLLGLGLGVTAYLSNQKAEAARLAAVADQLRADARMRQIEAESYRIVAESLYVEAATRDTVILTRYREVRDTMTIPEECESLAEFDAAIIDTLQTAYEGMRDAYLNEKMATGALLAQARGLEHAYDSLHTAYDLLAKPSAASLLSRLTPKLGAGVFAGVCTTGTPCAGVGVTLSWSF